MSFSYTGMILAAGYGGIELINIVDMQFCNLLYQQMMKDIVES